MKHEQPYWKCRTVSEINNLVVDFYNPLDFLNFGESMLSASVDQDLYKLMFTGSNNLFGSFIDRDLDFAVLYMVDPKQSRVTGGWTIDGHIDMELKIYRIKVVHALEWVKVPYSDVPKNIAKGTEIIVNSAGELNSNWSKRGQSDVSHISVSLPDENIKHGVHVYAREEDKQHGVRSGSTLYPCKGGEVYTLSFWVRNTSNHELKIRMQLGLSQTASQSSPKYQNVEVSVPNDNKWHHVQGTHTIPAGYVNMWFYAYTGNAKQGDTFDVAGFKVESGREATPWAPHKDEIPTTVWEVQDNGWVYNGDTSKNTTLQCVYWQLNYKFDPNNEASGYTRRTDQYNQVLGGEGCVITGYMIRGLKGY